MAKLEKLLENLIEFEVLESHFPTEVKGITYDSRQVKPGYIFVCIQGFQKDGHDFIEDAIGNGARVIVIEKDVPRKPGITYIKVKDSRDALSRLSEAYYDFASRKLNLIGVTGTNGKTTTTYMIESILRKANIKTGLIGTIRNKICDEVFPAKRTTPESSDLQELFARMVKAGVTHTVMEVSSHALELKRVQNFNFKVGVFTNITQDHLDFHTTLENYRQAKSKLFQALTLDGVGVINIDDPSGEYMIERCKGRVLTYGINNKHAEIRGSEIKVNVNGVSYHVTTPVGEIRLKLKLTGYFNVYNSLAAIGSGLALNIPLEIIKEGLESLTGVTGRFEQVDCGQNFGVIVDYAHTPDGMENILKTAQQIARGRKIIVFGCGGDRDRGKRPIMGKIAAKYCDLCILTSDNPRTEDPMQILRDIEKGLLELDQPVNYRIIEDRREAIFYAVREARENDLVIIMGKGHETYQIFKDYTIPFDDREVAKEAIMSL
ncbi:UDP-N-acetylmuramoyl-L-alanyl-D-glutamate--2,6-diaminopimelate ligase [Anoxybacter fermentans]|uniref:UDP-N-acetylmuramoyl-L-alanyl-D-glutamate--2,6-diaminopimelate ligase n=1 Tax=Anoxybacter fermentans TaxID=1323375 RepID=A0A3Q9HQ48_9FIRM|nr:UDP-N-acetylmuramoyl-L-alanyl-D-glutamate--2,6-diaminopimelate ligase [Anoxybacter fermentans]AZR73041.1 UDP-N-acetylmuramoyl-L-alanyl-D-glutamate--2,6-diaminopimelate ligase [Anoxybacter fermentans]